MATQPYALAAGLEAREGGSAAAWRAYHVYYHADRSHLLREVVRPLAGELLRRGVIDRFYFVRYELGGPHLRLRWRPTGAAAAEAAESALAERLAGFFERWPSPAALAEEKIRSINRTLQATDPFAVADVVHPDNSWRAAPLGFEVERYGGLELFDLSLDLFTVSSARVLLLDGRGGPDGGWVRPAFLRLALHLAWGFAGDERSFFDLVGYALRFMGEAFAPCLAEADSVFARRRQALTGLVGGELERLATREAGSLDGLAAAAGCLAGQLRGLPLEARWHLGASHIHMTANRLGLLNAEEVYLSRMLACAGEALREESPAVWGRLWQERPVWADGALAAAVTDALKELAA